MRNIFDDMLNEWLAYSNYLPRPNTVENNGFKQLIKRPHNVYTIRKDGKPDGQIEAYKLEVVTTPFKKEDVKVKIVNDVLNVTCGTTVKEAENANEFVAYKGISTQAFEFQLRLNKIDTNKITAKVEDGILTVYMPVIQDDVKQIDVKID